MMILMDLKLFFWVVLSIWTRDNELDRHFEAHRQADWQYMRTVTAAGEWYSEHGDILVNYYIKSPDKLAIVSRDQSAQRITKGLVTWESATWTEKTPVVFDRERTIAFNQLWYFGSPLWSIREELEKKADIQVDNYLCAWYQYKTEELVYDYFIRKKDHLLYGVSISDQEGEQLVSRKVLKYEQFGPFSLPSQISIVTPTSKDQYIFVEYAIGDLVKEEWFAYPEENKKP